MNLTLIDWKVISFLKVFAHLVYIYLLTVASWLQAPNSSIKSYDDLFDEDDKEDFLNRDFSEDDWGTKAATNDEDEDDFKMASGRPRNRGAIIEDDENSLG